MSKKIIFIILFFTISFAEKETWTTTRFEKSWYGKFKKMTFRKPFTFTPLTFKIGYLQYGGNSYWNNWEKVIKDEESLDSNPMIFSQGNNLFENITNKNNRRLITAELDLFKYNFFQKKQNIIDIQIGVGYKIVKSIDRIHDVSNNIDVFYKPLFQEYNVNATFYLQWEPKRFYNFFYSLGHVNADIYESNIGYATGKGIAQSFGIGLNFIRERYLKNNYSHYGFELRFDKYKIDDIDDPLNNITSFKSKQIGLVYSFSIGYGGGKSLGDEAYYDMINEDFISAVQKFESFSKHNKVKSRDADIEEMLSFSKKQIPYQMYENALKEYKDGYFQHALWWLNKAKKIAPDDLLDKILKQKILVITDFLKTSIDEESLESQINMLNSIRHYDEYNDELNKKIASLLIKKGDVLRLQNKFFDAYNLYIEAANLDSTKESVISLKLNEMTIGILNNVYIFLQNKENVIAYEHLFLVSDFSSKATISDALLQIADGRIEDRKIEEFRKKIQNILYGNQKFNFSGKEILLGDHYSHVLDILGNPIEVIVKRKSSGSYELSTFLLSGIQYKLFFKNSILIDVERTQ